MQFSGKYGKIVCWRPPGELAPPPRGNPGSATAPGFLEIYVCVYVRVMCVCMFKNIRPISQKAKKVPKDNTRPFKKCYTLKLKIVKTHGYFGHLAINFENLKDLYFQAGFH